MHLFEGVNTKCTRHIQSTGASPQELHVPIPYGSVPSNFHPSAAAREQGALPERNSLSSFGSTPALPSQRVVLLRSFSLLAFSNLSPRHFHRQVREASPLQGNFQNSVLLACSSKRGRRNRTDFYIYIYILHSCFFFCSCRFRSWPSRSPNPHAPPRRSHRKISVSCACVLQRRSCSICAGPMRIRRFLGLLFVGPRVWSKNALEL
jgi:hypothetical protein